MFAQLLGVRREARLHVRLSLSYRYADGLDSLLGCLFLGMNKLESLLDLLELLFQAAGDGGQSFQLLRLELLCLCLDLTQVLGGSLHKAIDLRRHRLRLGGKCFAVRVDSLEVGSKGYRFSLCKWR